MNDSIGALQLADWRRRVFGMYAGVRHLCVHDPAAGHEFWKSARDELFAGHPQSPLLPDDRARFTGLTVPGYDPDWRFELEVRRAEEPVRITVDSATDGAIPFSLVGTVRVPYLGTLDVWRLTGYGGGLFVPVKDGLAGMPGGTYGGGRYLLDTVKGADLGPGSDGDTPRDRLQLRLQPVVRLRPVVVVPARAARKHPARGDPRRRADAALNGRAQGARRGIRYSGTRRAR